ncbi:LysE family translocator [Pseudorhodobacter sp. E13]|uniref:LysE family translocator n=1 Tax=Pseudorhodobacter sp. E13 TaxID=2487931 RepID=UPI000F8F1B92|nr:LysE family translocator [Pseudorhodobacter sp. E13]RUS65221.1 LysE family translocator [Pseudorhodobacter sp. E13]
MPHLDAIFAVALAGFALSATPGPSMLYVASRSIGQSQSAGLASALGLGLGGVLLAVATAFGLATVFAQFDWVVEVLRVVGSAYLVWLGVDMIRTARKSSQLSLEASEVAREPFHRIVWQGILVELLNPKTVLFFALFLPPFIDSGAGQVSAEDVRLQFLVLGALVPLTAVPSDIVVAVMGSTVTRALSHQQRLRERLAWVGGLILIGIAVNLFAGVV